MLITVGMLLAPLAIVLLYLGWWMLFSYIVFALVHFLTIGGEIQLHDHEQYPKRSEYLYHAIVLVVDIIIACYPLFYMLADRRHQFYYYELITYGLRRDDYSSGGLALVLMLAVVAILGFLAWRAIDNVVDYRQHVDAIKQAEEEKRQMVARHQAFIAMLENKYGAPDDTFLVAPLCDEAYLSFIYFFTPHQHAVIAGEDFHFSQIEGCYIVEQTHEIPAIVEEHTTSNMGEMAVRSVLGHALFGKQGAIIGALTTPTTTESRTVAPGYVFNTYDVTIRVRRSPDKQSDAITFEHVSSVMAESLQRRLNQIAARYRR